MRKAIHLGSLVIVSILLVASCSSVASYQSLKTTSLSSHGVLNRLKEMIENISQKETNILSSQVSQLALQNKQISVDLQNNPRVRSLMSQCESFHDLAAATPDASRMLFVLVATILVEFFVYLMVIQAPALILFFISIFINVITNPAVNLAYYYIYDNVLVLETLVVLVETFLVYTVCNVVGIPLTVLQAAFISLLSNLMSYLIATGLARLVFGTVPQTE